jgi:hypothetical protein
MLETLIKNGQLIYGKLILADAFQIWGTHPRAESYYHVYSLWLDEKKLPGSYFDGFLLSKDTVFLTEAFLEIKQDCGILLQTELVQISLLTHAKRSLSTMTQGYVCPKKIEEDKLIYIKTALGQSIITEFEQYIKPF